MLVKWDDKCVNRRHKYNTVSSPINWEYVICIVTDCALNVLSLTQNFSTVGTLYVMKYIPYRYLHPRRLNNKPEVTCNFLAKEFHELQDFWPKIPITYFLLLFLTQYFIIVQLCNSKKTSLFYSFWFLYEVLESFLEWWLRLIEIFDYDAG